MRDETKKRLQGMSKDQKQNRLDELTAKLGITHPEPLNGRNPQEHDMDDLEEREWLKKELGY